MLALSCDFRNSQRKKRILSSVLYIDQLRFSENKSPDQYWQKGYSHIENIVYI